jgi:hypothetical protein
VSASFKANPSNLRGIAFVQQFSYQLKVTSID